MRKSHFFIFKILITAFITIAVGMWVARAYSTFSAQVKELPRIKQFFCVNDEAVKRGAQSRALMSMTPDFEAFNVLIRQTGSRDAKVIEPYRYYYQKITEYYPGIAEAYEILGFCYYHLQQVPLAVAAYQKAISLNPRFFYSYYNLGVIYLEQGRSEDAKKMFFMALRCRPEVAMKIVQSSGLYRQIFQRISYPERDMAPNLQQAYGVCVGVLKGDPQSQKRLEVKLF